MEPEKLYRWVLEEVERREKDGLWYLGDVPHPLPTAGAILLLHREGRSGEHHRRTLRKIAEEARDVESLRYVLRALHEMGLPREKVEEKLRRLYQGGMWKIMEGLPPDPLTTSAILVALHGTPLLMEERKQAVKRLKEEDKLPKEIEKLVGGQRPVLLNLYRALALALYGEREKARKIWEELKGRELIDLPPKVYLEKGMTEDHFYPAVLAAFLAREFNEDPKTYLEAFKNFDPGEEDTPRLVTFGFYLGKLLGKL